MSVQHGDPLGSRHLQDALNCADEPLEFRTLGRSRFLPAAVNV